MLKKELQKELSRILEKNERLEALNKLLEKQKTQWIEEHNKKLSDILKAQHERLSSTENNINALFTLSHQAEYCTSLADGDFMHLNLCGEEVLFTIDCRTKTILYKKDAVKLYFLGKDGSISIKYTKEDNLSEKEAKMFKKYNCVYIYE